MSSSHPCIPKSFLGPEGRGAAVSPTSLDLYANPAAPASVARPAKSVAGIRGWEALL